MDTSVKTRIEEEYDAYCEDKTKDLNQMYDLLYDYIRLVVASVIKKGSYIDHDMVSELTQEIMVAIATKTIHTFEKKEAKFVTFCTLIAKNKALDYVKKRDRHEMIAFDMVENEEQDEDSFAYDGISEDAGKAIFKNPELLLIRQERKLEQVEILKKYLQFLMDYKYKPYRAVSCCYSMVLFHKYHPDAKVLASPKWAYNELEHNTVEEGADRYHTEINRWFPDFHLYWGDIFQDEMDEKENGIYISDMVYGQHFDVRDFENWCLRMRELMRVRMFEEIQEVLE